jgi:hypothetical protein
MSFQFRSPRKVRRIPVSETGYRSHLSPLCAFGHPARNPAIISSRMSGLRGNEEMPDDMYRFYRTDSGCRQVQKCEDRFISTPSPPCVG